MQNKGLKVKTMKSKKNKNLNCNVRIREDLNVFITQEQKPMSKNRY